MTEVTEAMTIAAQGRLRTFIERVSRLDDDKMAIAADIKEVLAEAKGEGYDTKVIRKVVRLLRIDKAKRQEEDAITDMYMAAIGEA